jgi:O-antigen/teichoic acid export membrane protein
VETITTDLGAELRGDVMRGGVVTMASQAARAVLQIGSMIVLARLLVPGDFGLIAMVTALLGFLAVFKDLGLSMATIQRPSISRADINALFWINVAFSVTLLVLTAAIAPMIAEFYREPRLYGITLALAFGFLIAGLAIQQEAFLRRQMRFGPLAAIDVLSVVAGTAAGLVAAWYGAGYWALVLMQLVGGFVRTATVWIWCDWRPSRPATSPGLRAMLRFGGNLTGYSLINYMGRNVDNVLLGRFWGAQQLGLYDVAYKMLLFPLQQINTPLGSVAIPVLSRLFGSPDRYRRTYLRMIEVLAMLTMPLVAFMIVSADWLISWALGSRWEGAASIFALLGITALAQPVSNATGWLLISQGRTRHLLQWGVIGTTLSLAAIVAGLPWGATGVAAFYGVSGLLIRAPLLYWLVGREGPIHTADLYRAMIPAAAASATVLVTGGLFRLTVPVPDSRLAVIAVAALTVLVTYGVHRSLPSGRLALDDLRESLRAVWPSFRCR